MTVKKKKTKGDMTPMIDCVFLLLIFFIIAAKFITPEGYHQAWMPKGTGKDSTPITTPIVEDVRIYLRGGDKKNIRLHLDKHFFGEFNKDLVKWKKTDRLTKYKNELVKINAAYSADSGLEKRLAQLKASGNEMEVAIDADPDVPYIFIIKAIDACNALNIRNLKFTGAKKRLVKQNEGVIH